MTSNYQGFSREEELYQFLKQNFIPDLCESEHATSRYDCFSKEYNLDIELKCRRRHYNELIIERSKYNALLTRSQSFNTIPVYVNSTPKGVWAFYLFRHPDLEWDVRDLPRHTDFSRRENIPKEVGYLKVEEGINLLDIINERQ